VITARGSLSAAGGQGWIIEAPLIRSTWPLFPQAVRRPVLLWQGQHDAAVPRQEALAVRVEVDGR